MNSKRKKAQDTILKYIDKIAPGGYNLGLYKDLFKNMNDNDFDLFMNKLKNKKLTLQIIAPVDNSVKLNVKRNLSLGKELGYDFFQPLIIGPKGSKTDSSFIGKYKTPIKYLVYDMPVRRTSQLLAKGVSVGTDNNVIDISTGQVTGDSKAAKITKPEIDLVVSMVEGTDALTELLAVRGGDAGLANAADASISRYGKVSQKTIEPYGTGVQSTKTMEIYFRAAMINPKGL